MNSNDKDFNIETFYVIIDNNIPTQISPEKLNDKSKYVIIRKIHYGSGFFYTAKKGKGYPEERAITFEQFKTAFDYLTQHTSENIMKNNSQTAKLIKYLGLSEEAPANIVNVIANVPIEAAAATEAKVEEAPVEAVEANIDNQLLHKITSRPVKYNKLPVPAPASAQAPAPAPAPATRNLSTVITNGANGVNDANSANGINYLDSLFNPTSNASTKNTLITPITPTNHTTVEREVNINNLSTLPNSNSSNANLLTSNSSTSATVAPSPRREAWKGGRKTRKNKKSKRKHTRRH